MGDSIDRELTDLTEEARWRIWMGRIEAVLFAAPRPVDARTLSSVIGGQCDLAALLNAIDLQLQDRPYAIVAVAGGYQMRTRPAFAAVIQASEVLGPPRPDLTQGELTLLMAIAYFQPVTRAGLSALLGRPVNRNSLSVLGRRSLVAAGARSPLPGAPYSYVTTRRFLEVFGFRSLAELPDMDRLAASGLLDRDRLAGENDPAAALASPRFAELDGPDEEDTVVS